jgi:hypothetical protein
MGRGKSGIFCLVCFITSFLSFLFSSSLFFSYVEGGRVEENVTGLSRLILDRVPSTLLPQMMKSVLGASNCQKGRFRAGNGKDEITALPFYRFLYLPLSFAKLTNTRMRVGLIDRRRSCAGLLLLASAYTTTTTTTTTSINALFAKWENVFYPLFSKSCVFSLSLSLCSVSSHLSFCLYIDPPSPMLKSV